MQTEIHQNATGLLHMDESKAGAFLGQYEVIHYLYKVKLKPNDKNRHYILDTPPTEVMFLNGSGYKNKIITIPVT